MKTIEMHVGRKEASLLGYLQDYVEDGGIKNLRPSVVICAGGAYRFLSWREKDHAAMLFLAQGYNVFLLDYSVKEEAKDLNPLLEASDAVMRIRQHAVEWLCDPMRVAILGFSAGAHVAASLAVHHASERLLSLGKVEDEQNRPDACILCYPVITSGPYAHRESIDWVTGKREEEKEFFSLEKQVNDHVPPCFIWHTVEDESVPVENSMLFASALRKHHIPFELHLFQHGAHGLSTCDGEVNTPQDADRAWINLCLTWLGNLFDYSKN